MNHMKTNKQNCVNSFTRRMYALAHVWTVLNPSCVHHLNQNWTWNYFLFMDQSIERPDQWSCAFLWICNIWSEKKNWVFGAKTLIRKNKEKKTKPNKQTKIKRNSLIIWKETRARVNVTFLFPILCVCACV